ncbi:uncharacterized protein LOC123877781 isoform X2 [Maniola jurtina]|uniref:uncharacterized protein LOC123877781 isoform X2 n=1 Tax=Maniola jurtina TaxID=191418 RepID=UPI001E68EDEB|nr:uncharacterized protein LOC123877781 isoform X2 [Maniola jurtina]
MSHNNSRKQLKANLSVLHRLQPMPSNIAQAVFEKKGLEKPTQNLFNNLTYYLLSLIDPQFHSSMTCPLYDTRLERAFRSELSGFISHYAAKGLLTDVRSSYLVHPSCQKVTLLMYQLSILAVKQMLTIKIKGTEKQKIFDEVSEKFNKRQDDKSFSEYMKNLNYEDNVLDKLDTFLEKRQHYAIIAEKLRTKITESKEKLSILNPKAYINSLIDGFNYDLVDVSLKDEILKIKDIKKPAPIFEEWLKDLDEEVDNMEGTWDTKVLPLLNNCRNMYNLSKELVKRETGQIEKSCYMLTYDPSDAICTDELQNEVNSSQKYILQNIQQNGRLNFPNLIQAFLISMSYILKSNNFENETYFNERVRAYQEQLGGVRAAFQALLERVDRNEKRLQPTPVVNVQSMSIEDHWQIPPLPDLSGLKMKQNQYNFNFDTFTPLNHSKHQFNLCRRGEVVSRPPPRPVPTYHAPKDDFLKTLLSSRVRVFDRENINQSSNTSVKSNIKVNETIAGCSSGFTKEQVARLLSTKKSSIKKHKKAMASPDNDKLIKGQLFNESVISNDKQGLFRSYSSPNLLGNSDKKPLFNIRGRKLSIMQEDSPPSFNVSGVVRLDNNFDTPNAENSGNTINFQKISDEVNIQINNVHRELENIVSPILVQESHAKVVTASRIPRIITTAPVEDATKVKQDMHFSKTDTARELQESHSTEMTSTKELSKIYFSPLTEPEANSSKNMSMKDLQESHHSLKTDTTRELQESHLSEMTTTTELSKIYFSPITEPEANSPKTMTVKDLPESYNSFRTTDLQESHLSKMTTTTELPGINLSPDPEAHSFKTVTVRKQDSHSLKTVTPRVSISSMQETHTPKPNAALIKKTSSLEKIINRFKQVRAKVIPVKEENENLDTNNDLITRNLLPDLLSPSFSLNRRSNSDNNFDIWGSDTDDVVDKGPRVSLGTMLGVDHTFLDQFDLSD